MTSRPTGPKPPAIIHGARALAVLSLIWSGYAISDLMHSGIFGVSVAVAGDIGWLTVLWAEYHAVSLFGSRHAPAVAGWLIAAAVGVLLVLHGAEHSIGQAIAGPLVVFVGKIVWAFALAALQDPTAPTAEQLSELHAVVRDSSHEAAMLHARAKGRIARIRAEASVTLARDDTDFEITLERQDKQAELLRRTPLAITSSIRPSEQANEFGEQASTPANTAPSDPNTVREQIANSATTSTNPTTGKPILADLIREQVANTTDNRTAVIAVMEAVPDANRESVAAAVRRERRKTQGYA